MPPAPFGAPSSPSAPAAAAPGASGRAITILVLGIVGLLCCNLTAPVAWVLGRQELRDINLGAAPAQDQSFAQIGMVLGMVGTVLLVFALLWMFAFGGLAMMSMLLQNH